MTARIRSLAVTPGRSGPSTRTAQRLRACAAAGTASRARARPRWCRCRTRARRTRRACGVAVAADDGHARLGQRPAPGPITWTMPWPVAAERVQLDAEVARSSSRARRSCAAACRVAARRSRRRGRAAWSASSDPSSRPCARAGARWRPRSRSPANACGRGHLVDEVQVDVEDGRRRPASPAGRGARPRSSRTACAAWRSSRLLLDEHRRARRPFGEFSGCGCRRARRAMRLHRVAGSACDAARRRCRCRRAAVACVGGAALARSGTRPRAHLALRVDALGDACDLRSSRSVAECRRCASMALNTASTGPSPIAASLRTLAVAACSRRAAVGGVPACRSRSCRRDELPRPRCRRATSALDRAPRGRRRRSPSSCRRAP